MPTWNYVAIEMEGVVRKLDDAELVAQLDTLSAAHEARVGANPPWTRAKMNPALFSKMTGAIVGFEMRIAAWRPTIKLSQNKSTDERGRVIAGVEATGHGALAELIRPLGGAREGACPKPTTPPPRTPHRKSRVQGTRLSVRLDY